MKKLLSFSLYTVKKSEYEIYAYRLMESHFFLLVKEGINLIFFIVIFPLKVLNVFNNGNQVIILGRTSLLRFCLFKF